MRIHPHDLENQLKQLAPAYLVFGEEPLQFKEAVDALRKAAKEQGYLERQILEINSHFDWSVFEALMQTSSLFSSKRLIECRLLEGKLSKEAGESLKKYLSSPSTEDILLITATKLEAVTLKTPWFTVLEKQGILIQVRSLAGTELFAWLENRIHKTKLKASKDVIQVLLERTEGNLLAAAQTIEKLALIHTESNPITPEEIVAITEMDARFSLFDLIDAVASGSSSRTVKIFSCLKKERMEPILILWALTREIRVLLHILYGLDRGQHLTALLTQYGVWKRREKMVAAFMKRFSKQEFQCFLQQAKTIDDMVKNRIPGDVWSALSGLCLTLSGGYACLH